MKKYKRIYNISTGIIVLIMLFSMYKMYTPDYDRMHLPNYLRVELTVFKILGIAVLLIPRLPMRLKEWAYAGFGITLICFGEIAGADFLPGCVDRFEYLYA